MAIWDKMFNSNKNDDQNSKGNLAGDASKMLIGLKTKKIKMYATLGLFGVFAFMFVLVFVASLIVGPLYTNDKKASETWSGYEGDAQLSAYQQEIIDKYGESVTSYDMSTDSYNEITQELYYEKLNQVYEQYLKTPNIESVESNGSNWFVRAWTAIKNFFTGGNEPHIPAEYSYGVEIDSRLITSTLYAERFLGTSLDDDDQNAEFYVQEVADDSLKYRNLHSTTFRDETEKQYLEEAAGDLQSRQMLAVNGIEILSKYMIKRVETYLTIQEDYADYEFHDTTRNIDVKYIYLDCIEGHEDYIVNINSAIKVKNKVFYGANYYWDTAKAKADEHELPANCPISAADDSQNGDHGADLDTMEGGLDYLRYDIDCDTYKNYLELLKYGPFGESNPYPVFTLQNIDSKLINYSKDKKHLIVKLNNEVTLLGFNLANKFEEKYNNYEAIFTLDKNNLIKNKLSCKCIEINGRK